MTFHNMRVREAPTFLLLAVLAFGLLSFSLGSPGFYDYDEGMYAEIAHEMLATGRWIIPHVNGVVYLEKPPLVYWDTALSFRLLGESEWAGRLPVVLCGTLGVLAIFSLVRLWCDRRTALAAGLTLATSFGYFLNSRTILLDVPLTAFISVSILGLAITTRYPGRGCTGALLYWAGAGCGLLTKGLLGLVVPLLILAACGLILRGRVRLGNLCWIPAVSLFLIIVIPWHLAAALEEPRFLDFYLWKGQFARYLASGRRVFLIADRPMRAGPGPGVPQPTFLLGDLPDRVLYSNMP